MSLGLTIQEACCFRTAIHARDGRGTASRTSIRYVYTQRYISGYFSSHPVRYVHRTESLWSHTGSPNLVQLHKDIARLGGVLWIPDRVVDLDVQLSRVVGGLLALEGSLDDRTCTDMTCELFNLPLNIQSWTYLPPRIWVRARRRSSASSAWASTQDRC